MPVARPETSDSRVIAHVDLDCFYVQVEQRKQPELRGNPAAVVQYNEWKGGGLIAVSYEARAFGVKRSMRGDEAKQVCSGISLVQVPVARGKADLSTYRNAGSEVVSILARRGTCERASIDEVYLDLTEAARAMLVEAPPERLQHIDKETLKSHVLGLQVEDGDNEQECVRKWLSRADADLRDKLLACGALIVAQLRMQVLAETQFTCSAGIAHNKMLAKLASGMNKPAQQTVVPSSSVKSLLESLPVKKMKQLGGKLGISLEDDLGVNTVGDLLQFSEEKLQNHYGVNTGTWLWNIARGINGEEVQGRLLPKSHGSGKSFPGPRALKTVPSVLHWLNQLCEELNERLYSDLKENKRIAHTLTLHASAYKNDESDSKKKFPSKSCPLRYGSAKIQEDASNLFQAALREYLGSYSIKPQGCHQSGWGITGLSVSASKIIDVPSNGIRQLPSSRQESRGVTVLGTSSIMKYFSGRDSSSHVKQDPDNSVREEVPPQLLEHPRAFVESSLEPIPLAPPSGSLPFLTQQDDRTAYEEEVQLSNFTSREVIQDGFVKEHSQNLTSGRKISEGLNHGNQQSQYQRDESKDKLRVVNTKRKGAALKEERGTLLKFLTSCSPSCSSTNADKFDTSEAKESLSGDRGDNNSSLGLDQDAGGVTWNHYKADEIDPTVVDELPQAIQDEIRAWLGRHHTRKQQNAVKRTSTIADYFLPTTDK